jgi:hypothetical protein
MAYITLSCPVPTTTTTTTTTTTSTTTTTTTGAITAYVISTTSASNSGDACTIGSTSPTPVYGNNPDILLVTRFFSDSGGGTAFNGGGNYWAITVVSTKYWVRINSDGIVDSGFGPTLC